MSKFEQASRVKLRFVTPQGKLSVEDLWDLPLVELDNLAKGLYAQAQSEEVSFIEPKQAVDAEVKLRFGLVKHVIEVKLAERDQAVLAVKNREKKQRILALIAQKEDEELLSASKEELLSLVNEL